MNTIGEGKKYTKYMKIYRFINKLDIEEIYQKRKRWNKKDKQKQKKKII